MPVTTAPAVLLVAVPPAVVTWRIWAVDEATRAGVTAVKPVALIGTMLVSGTPPNVAVSGVAAVIAVGKFVPVTVTVWPPAAGPVAGTIGPGLALLAAIVGAEATMKLALPSTTAVVLLMPWTAPKAPSDAAL